MWPGGVERNLARVANERGRPMSRLVTGRRSPIGIDVGGRAVKAVQLERGRGGWRVAAAAAVPRLPVERKQSGGHASPAAAAAAPADAAPAPADQALAAVTAPSAL